MANAHRFYVPVGVVSLPVPPASPQTGDTYFDTVLGLLQTWDGSGWVGFSSDADRDARYLNAVGDTMSGELVLPDQVAVPPSIPVVVAAKGYVDQLVTVSDVPPVAAPARDGLIWSVVPEPWTPFKVPGLGLWLEADKMIGLADGAAVTTWPDASGHGRGAVALATPPTWRQAGVNGRPSVQFTASPITHMKVQGWGTALSNKTEYTMFQVLTTSEVATFPIILSAPTYSTWTFLTEFGPNGDLYWGHPGNYYSLYKANVLDTPMVYSFVLGGGAGKFYKDGTEIVANPAGLYPQVPDIGTDVLLGGYYNSTLGLTGHVAAMIWYDRALTDVERQRVEAYLRDKYGL